MSTGGRDDDGPEDDPFAFEEDDPAPGAADGSARAPDDPFAFPEDEEDASGAPGEPPGEAAAPGPAPPPARRRRRRGRPPAAADDERAARVRVVADEAAAHARAVGVRWLAVAVVVLVVLAAVTTIGGGPDAGGDVDAGERLPDFAAPLVSAPRLEREDVNLATRDGQGEAGKVAACSIRDPSVVTSCGLLSRGPLVLVVFTRGVGSCVEAVDFIDAERRRFPGLQALAVSLLGRHDSTGETARDRGWRLPVVYDRDGALATVLGVPACPLVLFVRRDGTVDRRIIGKLDRAELVAEMRRLAAPPARPGTTVDATPPGR